MSIQELIDSAIKNDTWMKEAKYHIDNADWLILSSKIAVKVLRQMRLLNMSKSRLSAETGLSRHMINKIVKGKEDLSLGTIAKLEDALGIKLISIEVNGEKIR